MARLSARASLQGAEREKELVGDVFPSRSTSLERLAKPNERRAEQKVGSRVVGNQLAEFLDDTSRALVSTSDGNEIPASDVFSARRMT